MATPFREPPTGPDEALISSALDERLAEMERRLTVLERRVAQAERALPHKLNLCAVDAASPPEGYRMMRMLGRSGMPISNQPGRELLASGEIVEALRCTLCDQTAIYVYERPRNV